MRGRVNLLLLWRESNKRKTLELVLEELHLRA